MRQVPARRFVYYLTPRGFAEKSRLTGKYLSYSLSLFRQAKKDCTAALGTAKARGYTMVAIVGVSDLAEIASICALELGITIVAVVDASATVERVVGVPVAKSFDEITFRVDAVIITDFTASREAVDAAISRFGAERVLVPALLAGYVSKSKELAA